MDNPVIVSAVRTPIGKFLGTLAGIPAPRLGALAVGEAVARAGLKPEQIDEVIMGNVVGAGLGQNPARQAAIFGGIPDTVPAMTVNKVCGSSLKAVVLAAQAIKCGDAEIIVAGGMESMSNAPYIMKNARAGFRMGNQTIFDAMILDGLWDADNDYHMGKTGEVVAERWQRHASSRTRGPSTATGRRSRRSTRMFKREIVAVDIPGKKGDPVRFDTDESPRARRPEALRA
jgi:acetyl-CoA C-acetyltransferase